MTTTNTEGSNLESNKKKKKGQQNTGLRLVPITAKTDNQKKFFGAYNKHQVISLSGYAGTGKTFIALYRALKSLEDGEVDNVMVIRSAVASRDIGFLKGDKNEKMGVYESPYIGICSKLYGRGDAYTVLKQKGQLTFESSSFMRGETFDNRVIIVDEAQNMSYQELYTLLTRLGENCKLILCGDMKQDDLTSERFKERSGFDEILKKLEMISPEYYTSIHFNVNDIVRSGFVKEFIIATSL